LLSLPSGKMVIVQEKTILGPRRGSITRIVPGAVFIEERVVNLLGQEEKIETIIEFKEKKNSEQRANL
ncbi:MAG TPA: hypothetical protein PLH57_10450, partial [Oligoflexia bacterium]|nr:hypothetical protein [Oligoflexia bacterium]